MTEELKKKKREKGRQSKEIAKNPNIPKPPMTSSSRLRFVYMMEVDTCTAEDSQDVPCETLMPVHTNIKNIKNKSRRTKAFVELKREKRKVSLNMTARGTFSGLFSRTAHRLGKAAIHTSAPSIMCRHGVPRAFVSFCSVLAMIIFHKNIGRLRGLVAIQSSSRSPPKISGHPCLHNHQI